jgi:glycosyltransferase involved in cell wall biosynthesis
MNIFVDDHLPLLDLSLPTVPVHLCILVGADNRSGVIANTIRVCHRYFERIHVLDTGSTDETESVCQSSPKVAYRRLAGFWGDTRAAYAEAVRDVPTWEWFVMLDSDERPSQYFLDHVASLVDEATARRVNCRPFPLFMHLCRNGNLVDRESPLVKNNDGTQTFPGFEVYRFWQKHPELCAAGWGAHGGFQLRNQDVYVPLRLPSEPYFVHCKTWDEILLSTFVFTWVWPQSHSIATQTQQYHELIALKKELNLNNCNTLSYMLYDRTLPSQIIELMQRWHERRPNSDAEQSELRVPHQMASFILNHYCRNCVVEKYGYCGQECCRYRNVQL